jgi:hypothetical protein
MDRFIVLVFVGATATIIDCEPIMCDGCTDALEAQNWAVEKHAEGREVYNAAHFATEAECKAYIARNGYRYTAD